MPYLLKSSSQVVSALEHTARSIKDNINNHFKEQRYDISYEQWEVINVVSENEGLTQIQIAKISGKEPASICRTIKYLCKKDILEKVKDKNNKRNNRIFLTDKGRLLSYNARLCLDSVSKNYLSNIYDREVNMLIKLLERIQNNYVIN